MSFPELKYRPILVTGGAGFIGSHLVDHARAAAVYGEPRYTPIDEAHPTDPISPYGASKLAGEKMGAVFQRVYDINFTTVRIFNVYGPRQSMYVMYDFMVKLSKSPRRLEVLGDGGQRRCYVFTDDAVEGILIAAKNAPGEIVNLSGDESVSVNELAEKMIPELSPGSKIFNTGAFWKGDIQILVGDNSKLKSMGFQPRTPLADGIRKLIEWHQKRA